MTFMAALRYIFEGTVRDCQLEATCLDTNQKEVRISCTGTPRLIRWIVCVVRRDKLLVHIVKPAEYDPEISLLVKTRLRIVRADV
jgi:hypothetical protein